MYTLDEYLKYNRKTQINSQEAAVFGVRDRSKGWRQRYASVVITQAMIDKLGLRRGRGMKATRLAINNEIKIEKLNKGDDKYLYLMRNPIGMLKVGVSQDPKKRARQITGACGMLIEILAVWEFSETATVVESMVMESLSKHRLHGEWFTEGSVSVDYVTNFLDDKGIKNTVTEA